MQSSSGEANRLTAQSIAGSTETPLKQNQAFPEFLLTGFSDQTQQFLRLSLEGGYARCRKRGYGDTGMTRFLALSPSPPLRRRLSLPL
ncbi:hypothetical protein H6F76_22320 [Leptolyngbya sp. FACHB-321]|uniref:hypothetical protein n=1 Tax=Leptolyngbya sp. FACHB-321 TaxID=2692807 RepID=UPI00168419A9|nr:hypothetical protein [Leptolyngbya sp. FACHB-321]MBD2037695.1 hypothetical protein [Leptolyngbya sp. FACHB-321]